MKSRAARGLTKITINLPPEVHGVETETVWAEDVTGNKYRLRSVPFYARDLSFDDVIVAHEKGGALFFEKVALRGGHSTYRIFLAEDISLDDPGFLRFWKSIEGQGGRFERATTRLLGVDVLPGANIREVYRYLEAGEEAGIWEFEEGHCGHTVD